MYNRHSIRLKNYDYSEKGMYFITICIKNRQKILSNISNPYLNNKICKKVFNDKCKNVGALSVRNTTKDLPNCALFNNTYANHNCNNILELSTFGMIIEKELLNLNRIHKNISIISYIIMPDHIHFILQINKTTNCVLGDIIKTFKSITNKKINKIQKINLWQRNYYEHIIRNEKELFSIIKYIENNPYKLINDK